MHPTPFKKCFRSAFVRTSRYVVCCTTRLFQAQGMSEGWDGGSCPPPPEYIFRVTFLNNMTVINLDKYSKECQQWNQTSLELHI